MKGSGLSLFVLSARNVRDPISSHFRLYLKEQQGIALVVTLLALVLITAMVVEFSYGVFTGTNNLYNWRDSQRLSIMAKSGINVSAKFLPEALRQSKYATGSIEFPVENPFEDFKGAITIRIEDESSKFNLNALVNARGEQNEVSCNLFRRLLRVLSLDEKIADKISDWIDRDSVAALSNSEVNAKNSALLSVDELLLINGISRKDYDTLLPYVTVYGPTDSLLININGAEKPVLRCLADAIDDDLAQRVIDYRKNNPFLSSGDLSIVRGFEKDIGIPSGVIAVKGENFSIRSRAESGGVKKVIEAVLDNSAGTIKYWKEY